MMLFNASTTVGAKGVLELRQGGGGGGGGGEWNRTEWKYKKMIKAKKKLKKKEDRLCQHGRHVLRVYWG